MTYQVTTTYESAKGGLFTRVIDIYPTRRQAEMRLADLRSMGFDANRGSLAIVEA